jgi:anti-anti-sigma factor
MFEIKKENDEVRMTGRFDASRSGLAMEVFNQVHTTIFVNFEGLDYISSAGLSVLLKTQKRLMEKGHSLRLKNMNKFNREIFKLAGFEAIFEILE